MSRKWRWVSRDKKPDVAIVDVWEQENQPLLIHHSGLETEIWVKPPGEASTNMGVACVCHAEFMRLFGIDVKPGECIKV